MRFRFVPLVVFLALSSTTCDDRLVPPETPPEILSITLSPSSVALEPGERVEVEVEVETSTGDPPLRVVWSSSDTTVAAIEGTTKARAFVAGISMGSATIEATAEGTNEETGSADVSVVQTGG